MKPRRIIHITCQRELSGSYEALEKLLDEQDKLERKWVKVGIKPNPAMKCGNCHGEVTLQNVQTLIPFLDCVSNSEFKNEKIGKMWVEAIEKTTVR
jgi:hypothetical protein